MDVRDAINRVKALEGQARHDAATVIGRFSSVQQNEHERSKTADSDALALLLRVVEQVGTMTPAATSTRLTEDGRVTTCQRCGASWPADDVHVRNGCLELTRAALAAGPVPR